MAAPIAIMGDAIFWPVDGLPGAPSEPLERLFAAVAGGLMTGWGAMFVAFGRGASIGRALVAGAVAWFVVDSTGSVMAGVPLNVARKVSFLALMLWAARPLAGGRPGSDLPERGQRPSAAIREPAEAEAR